MFVIPVHTVSYSGKGLPLYFCINNDSDHYDKTIILVSKNNNQTQGIVNYMVSRIRFHLFKFFFLSFHARYLIYSLNPLCYLSLTYFLIATIFVAEKVHLSFAEKTGTAFIFKEWIILFVLYLHLSRRWLSLLWLTHHFATIYFKSFLKVVPSNWSTTSLVYLLYSKQEIPSESSANTLNFLDKLGCSCRLTHESSKLR